MNKLESIGRAWGLWCFVLGICLFAGTGCSRLNLDMPEGLSFGKANLVEDEIVAVHDWPHLPPGMEAMGACHGDVAVSSNGEVYVSVQGGDKKGVQVYSAAGDYLRNVPNAPPDFHGFVIREDDTGEYLYGASLFSQTVFKMTLDGDVVLKIPGSSFPEELKIKFQGNSRLAITAVDVALDGRIFVVDGYASDYIHVFEADGDYLKSFGGKQPPYNFKTNHKIAIDNRFDPARILCCDRENRRVVHLSIDGDVLGTTYDVWRPAAVAVYGDWAAVAEIEGRISLLDKEGVIVRSFGQNAIKEQTATNKVKPEAWRAGALTAPHGIAFDKNGDIVVAEFNEYGRLVRYEVK